MRYFSYICAPELERIVRHCLRLLFVLGSLPRCHHLHRLAEEVERLKRENSELQTMNHEVFGKENNRLSLENDRLAALLDEVCPWAWGLARVQSQTDVWALPEAGHCRRGTGTGIRTHQPSQSAPFCAVVSRDAWTNRSIGPFVRSCE